MSVTYISPHRCQVLLLPHILVVLVTVLESSDLVQAACGSLRLRLLERPDGVSGRSLVAAEIRLGRKWIVPSKVNPELCWRVLSNAVAN